MHPSVCSVSDDEVYLLPRVADQLQTVSAPSDPLPKRRRIAPQPVGAPPPPVKLFEGCAFMVSYYSVSTDDDETVVHGVLS